MILYCNHRVTYFVFLQKLKEYLHDHVSQQCSTREYEAVWGGVVNNRPLAGSFGQFNDRVFDDLWQKIEEIAATEMNVDSSCAETAEKQNDGDNDVVMKVCEHVFK